ncbi:MAG: hypothetical protein ACTSRA_00825 [Promethearchaeota archaeon]
MINLIKCNFCCYFTWIDTWNGNVYPTCFLFSGNARRMKSIEPCEHFSILYKKSISRNACERCGSRYWVFLMPDPYDDDEISENKKKIYLCYKCAAESEEEI